MPRACDQTGAMLGSRQVAKAAGFGPAIRGFESFLPSHFSGFIPA